MPSAEAFIRQYMAEAGCDIPRNWDSLGETAVLAWNTNDERLKLAALKELNSHLKVKPRPQDMLSQPTGGIKPLHVGLADDVLIDGEYQEIEEEADAEFSESFDDVT